MKNVILRDDTYSLLKRIKGEKESFGDVIERLFRTSGGKKAISLLREMAKMESTEKDREFAKTFKKGIKVGNYDTG